MTLRSTTLRTGAGLAVATIAVLSLAGPAGAAPSADRDCKDFPNRAAAQAALNADPSDPDGLDRDNDGLACEDHLYPGSGSSTAPEPGSSTPEPAAGTEPTGTRPAGDAAPDRPGHVAAVPAGGVEAGDGSAEEIRDGGSGTAFVLTGFGVVVVAGAACSVRGARRPAGTGASVPSPRAAGDDRRDATVAPHRR